MTAVVYVLAGVVAVLAGVCAAQGYWLHAAGSDKDALRDLYESQVKVTTETARDRDGFKADRDATRIALKEAQDRLAAAESQRNDAYKQGAQDVVDKIKAGGIADAAAMVERLSVLPGVAPAAPVGVLPAKVSSDSGSASVHRDDLERPV